MADGVCKEPPVLNLVINVINIAPVPGSLSLVSTVDTGKPRNDGPELETKLGYVVLRSGRLVPFGVKPTSLEVATFGERKYWKEVRVCLPPSLLAENETDNYCPVVSCREKLPKNKSMDVHMKKHLGTESTNNWTLPCPLAYYCGDKQCQYFVECAEKSFKAFKNMKQHYLKVHAPRVFNCDKCQKSFPTWKVLDTHKQICGETFSCTSCQASYNTLESLQTHCRRKQHTYDHSKYKEKRCSVKLEMTQTVLANLPPLSSPGVSAVPLRKLKTPRKLPLILPKFSDTLTSIQDVCHRAGLKVDLGCQTVCTAFIQNANPLEPTTIQGSSLPQKKRKSTDTQTNMVKFRATCQDQKHNATNTVRDWKKVVTSDSETQTPETTPNDEFATIEIVEECETTTEEPTTPATKVSHGPCLNPEFISFLEATDSATQTDFDIFDDLSTECFGIRGLFGDDDMSTECEENLTGYVSVSSTASQTLGETVATNSLSAEDYETLLKTSDDKSFPEFVKSEGLETLNNNDESLLLNGSSSANDFLFDWENIIEEVYRDGGRR